MAGMYVNLLDSTLRCSNGWIVQSFLPVSQSVWPSLTCCPIY